MAELLRAHCAQGTLTITDQMIIIERGTLTSATMSRAALTGLDARMMYWIPLPGMTRFHHAGKDFSTGIPFPYPHRLYWKQSLDFSTMSDYTSITESS